MNFGLDRIRWPLGFLSGVFLLATGVGGAAEEGVAVSSVAIPAEPFVFPLGNSAAKIVSGFGKRQAPVDPAKAETKIESHEGIDWTAFPGTSVKAARSGKVLFAGFSKAYVSRADKKEQARLIIIRHSDGKSTRYVHLNAIRVRPSQEVASGQEIGTASASDEWAEPVLHFEIRDPGGLAMNPEEFLYSKK